jgi:hypothetical protein
VAALRQLVLARYNEEEDTFIFKAFYFRLTEKKN